MSSRQHGSRPGSRTPLLKKPQPRRVEPPKPSVPGRQNAPSSSGTAPGERQPYRGEPIDLTMDDDDDEIDIVQRIDDRSRDVSGRGNYKTVSSSSPFSGDSSKLRDGTLFSYFSKTPRSSPPNSSLIGDRRRPLTPHEQIVNRRPTQTAKRGIAAETAEIPENLLKSSFTSDRVPASISPPVVQKSVRVDPPPAETTDAARNNTTSTRPVVETSNMGNLASTNTLSIDNPAGQTSTKPTNGTDSRVVEESPTTSILSTESCNPPNSTPQNKSPAHSDRISEVPLTSSLSGSDSSSSKIPAGPTADLPIIVVEDDTVTNINPQQNKPSSKSLAHKVSLSSGLPQTVAPNLRPEPSQSSTPNARTTKGVSPIPLQGSSFVRASALASTSLPPPSAPSDRQAFSTTPAPPTLPATTTSAHPVPRPTSNLGNVKTLWGNTNLPRKYANHRRMPNPPDTTAPQTTGLPVANPVPATTSASDILDEDSADRVNEDEDEEARKARFATYESTLPYGKDHPDPLVEAASLAACSLPPITYEPKLLTDPRGKKIIEEGAMSKIQLENLVYASQRHNMMLPNGRERAGFFIGDGAGVGKGRSIAGIVLENQLHAAASPSSTLWASPPSRRDRAVWFSISADLVEDAHRDLKDVGAGDVKLYSLTGQPFGSLPFGRGVLFSTYATLIGHAQKVRRVTDTRIGQIVEYCGGEAFEGLLIFDESHKGKNLVPPGKKKGDMGVSEQKGTQTGKAILEIQEKLPNARVLYVSATGASEPRNMAYMVRLGLWGENTPFPNFGSFLSAVSQRGAGAMECVACDMKAMGMYLSRTLSYSEASFEIAKFELDQTTISYDDAAKLWGDIKIILGSWVTNATEPLDGKKRAALWRYYWGCFSVVIGLQGTGEARTAERLEDDGDDLDDLVSAPREVAKGLVDYFALKCFGIKVGNVRSVRARKSNTLASESELEDESDDSKDVASDDCEMEIASEDEHGNVRLRKRKMRVGDRRIAPAKLKYDPRTGRSRRAAANYKNAENSDTESDFQMNVESHRRLKRSDNDQPVMMDSDDDEFSEESFFGRGVRNGVSRQMPKRAKRSTIIGSDTDEGENPPKGGKDAPVSKAPTRFENAMCEVNVGNPNVVSVQKLVPSKYNSSPFDEAKSVNNLSSRGISTLPTGTTDDYNRHLLPQAPWLSAITTNEECLSTSSISAQFGLTIGSAPDELNFSAMSSQLLGFVSFSKETVPAIALGLKSKIDLLALPNNPLDSLITSLGGPSEVAELTGRSMRAVVDPYDPSRFTYEARNTGGIAKKDVNLLERDAFQSGRKHVAIISDAASAGISLQADRRVNNQRRRVHITIELAWSADKAIQQLGRTHRSNQSSAPEYVLVISDIGGEMRFASAVAKRLESLGALTKGDRRAADGISLSDFNFETKWGKSALEALHASVDGRSQNVVPPDFLPEGVDPSGFFSQVRSAFEAMDLADNGTDEAKVKKFLNRLLGIHPVTLQNKIFDYFLRHLKIVLDEARRNGQLDAGIEDIGGMHCTVELANDPATVFEDAFSKIRTHHFSLRVDRGLRFEHALEIFNDCQNDHPKNGFYISSNGESCILAKDAGRSGVHARVYKPHLGEVLSIAFWNDLTRTHTRVTGEKLMAKAEKLWNRQFEGSATRCVHAMISRDGFCKTVRTGGECFIGKRIREYHILAGAVVPVWTRVEDALVASGCNDRIKIVRATITENDRRIIGIRIPGKYVAPVLAALATGRVVGDMDLDDN
ncbi:Protein strawberry notch 1 [Gonapodya sp. JEL0774]|nr:Protein strawberry notch 1 [Gonapodya sp. JEL0774]